MKTMLRYGAGSAVLAAALASAPAYAADTETATAEAEILSALTLVVAGGTTLDFAQIAHNGSAGTVSVAADGTRTCAAALVCAGTTSAVDFTVSGTADANVGITLPTSAEIYLGGVASTNSFEKMELSSFVTDAAGSAVTLTGGSANFSVGADLAVGGDELAGAYSGTFDVTVEYQ